MLALLEQLADLLREIEEFLDEQDVQDPELDGILRALEEWIEEETWG